MSEGPRFCLFGRDGCLAVVSRECGVLGGIGSTGLALDWGLAYLVWREQRPLLVAQNFEIPAEPEQVEKILRFSADLRVALELAPSDS